MTGIFCVICHRDIPDIDISSVDKTYFKMCCGVLHKYNIGKMEYKYIAKTQKAAIMLSIKTMKWRHKNLHTMVIIPKHFKTPEYELAMKLS